MLHVHRSERADGLVQALADLLAEPLDDPMAPEIVAVPTRGMERWLTQRLSTSLGATEGRCDGVCANIAFPWPRRVVGDAVAAASGVDPERDPWLPERATWPLLDVLEASLGEPWLDAVAEHLGADSDKPDPVRRARRLSVVRHAADLFDRYALNRPEMIQAWITGDDTDGAGGSLPPMSRWQAELWRRLRLRIGIPGPAERLEPACARLRTDAAVVDLPARLSLFGLTRVPAGHLHVLQAIAAVRDVHLFLLHPSPALWDEIAKANQAPHGRWAAPTIPPPSSRPTGCSPPGAATPARCSSCSAPPKTARITITRSSLLPPPSCTGSRATSEPTANLPDRRSPAQATPASRSTRATAASRSTRATAAPDRSR